MVCREAPMESPMVHCILVLVAFCMPLRLATATQSTSNGNRIQGRPVRNVTVIKKHSSSDHSPKWNGTGDYSRALEDDPVGHHSRAGTFIGCSPSQKSNPCNKDLLEECRQLNGVYRCLCPENISRTPTGKCTVFNECFESSSNNCSLEAECIDLEEGYSCRCKDGYLDESPSAQLPGRVCTLSDAQPGVTPPKQTDPPEDQVPADLDRAQAPTSEHKDQQRVALIASKESSWSALVKGEDKQASSDSSDNQSSLAATGLRAFQAASTNQKAPPAESSTGNESGQPSAADKPQFNDNTLREVFDSFDLDSNGLVEFQELRSTVNFYSLKFTDKQIELMVRVADKGGDGAVDFGEFETVMTR